MFCVVVALRKSTDNVGGPCGTPVCGAYINPQVVMVMMVIQMALVTDVGRGDFPSSG